LGHAWQKKNQTKKQLNCLLYAILKSRILKSRILKSRILKSAGKKSSQIRKKNDMIVARSKKTLFGTHLDAGIHPRAPHWTDTENIVSLKANLGNFFLISNNWQKI
jgi:hypothetical protein